MWNREATQPKTPEAPRPVLVIEPKVTVVARIGPSIFIKGDITSSEDLAIDGRVEGTIDVAGQRLTIGPGAAVFGDVAAGSMSISGAITGNVLATERIEVRETGSVDGDLCAPRLSVRDGAVLCGRVDTGAVAPEAVARPTLLPIAV